MSAIHERRYRLQREREIAQARVRETTTQYLERYQNTLNQLDEQGLTAYVEVEVTQIKKQLTQMQNLLRTDAFAARELSLSIGQRIYGLRALARDNQQIEIENQRLEALEKQRQLVEKRRQENAELEQAWQRNWQKWSNKLARNLALNELSALREKIFSDGSHYSIEQINQEMDKIQQHYEQLAKQQRESQQQKIEQVATQTLLQQLADDVQEGQLPLAETQQLQTDLVKLMDDPAVSFDQVKSMAQKTDQALEDESIRREMVKAVYESLQHAGFSVLKPKRTKNETEDIVIIQARRPSGNQAKFKIELDGKVRYEFDNYRGQSCKDDMIKVLPRLSEIYGVDLSDERVIWSNPDDEDQEMKPITPQNVHQR